MSRPELSPEDAHIARNARLGLWLFALYLLFYAGFVGITAFRPQAMDVAVVAGVNLAIVYGFGLIVAAIVLALFYGWFARDGRK